MIDELDREIGDCERELRRLGAEHRYVPLLCTVSGISWVLASTIAAEIGNIKRFPARARSPATPASAPASTNQASATCAARSRNKAPLPALGTRRGRHPRLHPWRLPRPLPANEARIGRQRGGKVAQVELARRLAEAIWHMLTRDQPFAPKGATDPLAA